MLYVEFIKVRRSFSLRDVCVGKRKKKWLGRETNLGV